MADYSGLSDAPSQSVGIIIAVVSSFINGSTFVLQKKGMLRSRDKGTMKLVQYCHFLQNVHVVLSGKDTLNLSLSSTEQMRQYKPKRLYLFPAGSSYLTDLVWWSGTLCSECDVI